jgi:hypothetical protein
VTFLALTVGFDSKLVMHPNFALAKCISPEADTDQQRANRVRSFYMRGISLHLGKRKKRLPLAIWIQLYSLLMIVHGRIRSRGRLKHTSTMGRAPIDGISQGYALGGRLLILFTAILIFVMPWTEYFWQFDRFLRGGQDFELSLLSLLTISSLVLVLLQQRRQNVTLLLTVRRWLSLVFEDGDPPTVAKACSLTAPSDAVPLSSRALCRYNLPIRV